MKQLYKNIWNSVEKEHNQNIDKKLNDRVLIIDGKEVMGTPASTLNKTFKKYTDDLLVMEKNRTGGNVANVVNQKNQANHNVTHYTPAALRFLLKDTNNATGG